MHLSVRLPHRRAMASSWGILAIAVACADDWPQFRGTHRDAVWNEPGIMQTFPKDGLKMAWKVNVGHGLASAVIANGHVFLIASELQKPRTRECVRCLDEKTGPSVWSHAYEVTYPDWAFDPAQNSGHLVCLDANDGNLIWDHDPITGKGQGAAIHLTPNGDSVLLFPDEGNLIRAGLTRDGYNELSCVHVSDPAQPFAGRNLVWPPPAYADGHIFIHNGSELVCAVLRAP